MPEYALKGGSITGVTAGNGLTGGGTEGNLTLNVGAGAGISVGADQVGIKAGGVTNAMLAAGAVTDAKISGKISGSKISSAGLNADKLDGLDSTAFVKKAGDTMTGDLKVSGYLYADGGVGGKYLVVNGSGGEKAFMGGEGTGLDIEIGSLNPAVTLVQCGTRPRATCDQPFSWLPPDEWRDQIS